MPEDLNDILERLKIREFEEDIFEMAYSELLKHFAFSTGALNVSMLIKNLIWQDYNKIQRGELELSFGNVRSYWYSRLKPVLARVEGLDYAHKYTTMSREFVGLVVNHRLFNYAAFGFADENQSSRSVGGDNRHIFCVAEKTGHLPLLHQLQRDYDITIAAFGGQPSALSTEYFLRELTDAGFSPEGPVLLFTIIDYDPSGDSIIRSFIWQMKALGFEGEFARIDLAHPSRMTKSQIRLNKFRLSQRKSERKKNRQWAAQTRGLEAYGHGVFYGLEADAMTWSQIIAAFDEEVTDYLHVPKDVIVRRRLKHELAELLMRIVYQRLFG